MAAQKVPILASPKLASWLYFVRYEGEGSLPLSSFPDMFQNKGLWVWGGGWKSSVQGQLSPGLLSVCVLSQSWGAQERELLAEQVQG